MIRNSKKAAPVGIAAELLRKAKLPKVEAERVIIQYEGLFLDVPMTSIRMPLVHVAGIDRMDLV